ncbi:MAG: hypothetical protein C0402_12905 [Thermodesulfovibrio sp.]|nr:hypothetical protein [Thermodesulfovibrio sp.]
MENKHNIEGIFESEDQRAQIVQIVRSRRICYDFEPYNYVTKQGQLMQIGYQLNIYGTFPASDTSASGDDPEFYLVLRDVRRVAAVILGACNPLHMCEDSFEDATSVSYAHERNMRPDVTVHVPIFDRQHFGQPVDRLVEETIQQVEKLLKAAGVQKKHWED